MKVLVIGGVAAGTKAAAKWKQGEPGGTRCWFSPKSADISTRDCGLP